MPDLAIPLAPPSAFEGWCHRGLGAISLYQCNIAYLKERWMTEEKHQLLTFRTHTQLI